MKDDIAIKVSHISKSFKVPHEKHTSLKSAAVNIFSSKKFSRFMALDGIDFEIKKGDFFGIVGKNGSGKSTLLKILANIYQPNGGEVVVNGTLAPFIELGVGFNPELTGRENVFLSGTILGMPRKSIEAIYDEIVDFAEIGEFMDQKLKNYSSGMQVRLAFSIAVRAESDILLIDEVLAVGDAAFQTKCFDYFNQLQESGKTIVFVTHDMSNVRRFCNRAVLISDSKILDIGHPNKIATQYDKINQNIIDKETDKSNTFLANEHQIKADISNNEGKKQVSYNVGEEITIRLEWPKDMIIENIGVAIMKSSGEYIFGRNTMQLKNLNLKNTNTYSLQLKLDIAPGRYYFMYGTFGKTRHDVVEFVDKGPGLVVNSAEEPDWEGMVSLTSKWNK